jgi:hypothetical protein
MLITSSQKRNRLRLLLRYSRGLNVIRESKYVEFVEIFRLFLFRDFQWLKNFQKNIR